MPSTSKPESPPAADTSLGGEPPLVSIIMPVYNGGQYIAEAIDSALAQTYPNTEIIVVNDGSTDDTDSIVLSYGDKIRYLRKDNGGVATALNLAIDNAQGDYVSWLSHDDTYMEDKIAHQVDELERRGFDDRLIIFANYQVINTFTGERHTERLDRAAIYTGEDRISILKVLFTSTLHGCSLLLPRKAFEQCGMFDPARKTTQDYALWYTMVEKGYRFVLVDKPLIRARLHEKQGTRAMSDICAREIHDLIKMVVNRFSWDLVTCSESDFRVFSSVMEQHYLATSIAILRRKRRIYRLCSALAKPAARLLSRSRQ